MGGRLGVIGANSSSAPSQGGRLGAIKVSQQELDQVQKDKKAEQAKTSIAESDATVKQSQADVFKPSNILGDIAKGVGNFASAVNEKVLGGATKAAVKAVNTVATGFNQDEANKRTDAFLNRTKQVNGQGQAPLASGRGVDRNSDEFKVGQGFGDVVKSLTVDVPGEAYKSARNVVTQAKMSNDIGTNGGVIGQKEADKLKKFVDDDEKAGKLTKPQADAKRNALQARADKTKTAIADTEKKNNAKVDQTSGVVDLLNTAANASGLGAIGKKVFDKVAETAAKRLGRDLTEEEATNLAAKTKTAVPESTVKPVEPTQAVDTEVKISKPTSEPVVETSPVKTIPLKQTNGEADVADLVSKSKLPEPTESSRPAIEQAKADIKSGVAKPIQVHATPDGQLLVKGSEDTLQAAKEMGVKSFPIEDVSNKDVMEPVTSVKLQEPVEKPVGDTISGNSSRIEQVALEKKLTNKMGDLPQYKSIDMKEQAKDAVDLVSNDRQHAIDIIDGKANPPGNLKAQSVHQALEDVAIKEGDGELLTKLAKSHVNTELSEGAQKLRIAAERDPHSPVEQIRQVRDARAKAAEKRSRTTVSKETKDIASKVKAATPKVKKETWASFVKGLEC